MASPDAARAPDAADVVEDEAVLPAKVSRFAGAGLDDDLLPVASSSSAPGRAADRAGRSPTWDSLPRREALACLHRLEPAEGAGARSSTGDSCPGGSSPASTRHGRQSGEARSFAVHAFQTFPGTAL